MSLVYLPERVWSTRYGVDYFTVKVDGYHVRDNKYAVYEMNVHNGKQQWKVFRRFSEFDRFRSNRWRQPTSACAGGRPSVLAPAKTYCCRDLNPDFLDRRRAQLHDFLQDLLVIPKVATDKAVKEFLQLHNSKCLFV
ncbi:TPA: hypothetical protein N0F65_001414 [Lagenidium giganteum]|uniref:PX domain-containing protein n=1 Tax=Lagenidium giganteum TaxID=4803 RepID=A0AAV2YYW2_9STRA|nr:TPA: hypothetical protein N0F65_001414 [Lagenidium giganteum]